MTLVAAITSLETQLTALGYQVVPEHVDRRYNQTTVALSALDAGVTVGNIVGKRYIEFGVTLTFKLPPVQSGRTALDQRAAALVDSLIEGLEPTDDLLFLEVARVQFDYDQGVRTAAVQVEARTLSA